MENSLVVYRVAHMFDRDLVTGMHIGGYTAGTILGQHSLVIHGKTPDDVVVGALVAPSVFEVERLSRRVVYHHPDILRLSGCCHFPQNGLSGPKILHYRLPIAEIVETLERHLLLRRSICMERDQGRCRD